MDLLSCAELQPSVLRKGAWSKEEDELLRKCIDKYGEGKWSSVPKRAGLKRCRKSCRLRWLNYLSPSINRGKFTEDEVDLVIRLHKLLGNRWKTSFDFDHHTHLSAHRGSSVYGDRVRWSLIASRIPGRRMNHVRNYWNSHLSKRVDGQHNKKVSTILNAEVIKPLPQRVPITWIWSNNLQGNGGQPAQLEEFNKPTRIENEEAWLNDLIRGDDEGNLDVIPHTGNILSSQDFHTVGYGGGDIMEIIDEALLLEGVKGWEKLLQSTICLG